MSNYLPSEIWKEIFLRLPLKSLVRCISVCKVWKSLIIDQSFIHSHLSNNAQAINDNGSLFIQFHNWKELDPTDYDFEEFHSLFSEAGPLSIFKPPFNLEHNFELGVVGSCNGLVCFVEHSKFSDINIVIMNPSIWKYIVLPKPNIPLFDYGDYGKLGFGFHSRNKDFKVIRLVVCQGDAKEPLPPEVEIYSLAAGKWSSVTNRILSGVTYDHPRQVFVNGTLHWIVYENRHGHGQRRHFILTFDLAKETFGELTFPQSWEGSSSYRQSLLDGGNSLALVLYKRSNLLDLEGTFYIWVMKEYGVADSWNLMFSVDSSHYGGISRVIALRSSGKLVLERNRCEIIILDPKKDLVKCVGLVECVGLEVNTEIYINFVGHYVESLFLIDKKDNVVTF